MTVTTDIPDVSSVEHDEPDGSERPAFDDAAPDERAPTRPRVFGDCLREGWGDHESSGPCPWVSCSHHLVWGRARPAQHSAAPGSLASLALVEQIDLDEMSHTCALRAADERLNLAQIGDIFGVSRERIRQVEAECLARMAHPNRADALGRSADDGHEVSRPDLHDAQHESDALECSILRASIASNDNDFGAHRNARSLVGEEREARIAELRARSKQSGTQTLDADPHEARRASLLDEIL